MKTMTCKQLGGACDKSFTAETFEELVELSKAHGMLMFQQQDTQHLEAMQRIMLLMQQPAAMEVWYQTKKKEFEALADN
ncbi:hypothetical protein [Catenovulum sediminis]|uniref:DUF1059 domain-containing protein n=1 Tax=Catenovulum sediminis TaxID=1740262 RepID=A0ABV1RDK0_9ALTE